MAILQLEHLSKSFQKKGFNRTVTKAVDDVSLWIEKGETFGLVGESGCGKSTLGRIICRLITQDEGSICYDGQNISSMKDGEFRPYRSKIQMLFQHPDTSLNPRMSVLDCLKEPLILHQLAAKQEMEDRIREHIPQFGIQPELLTRKVSQVSGGQIQRIVLARIMLLTPGLIVLDEPTSMLDVSVQAQMMELLKEVQQKSQVSYLLISHDLDLVSVCSHRLAVMKSGKILETGVPHTVLTTSQDSYIQQLQQAFHEMKF